MADWICFVGDKCKEIIEYWSEILKFWTYFEIFCFITYFYHFMEILVNFTIMSWLLLTVVQLVVKNYFHKRNNLTNRFCSGFKLSDSVSMMIFCYSLTLVTKYEFGWQNLFYVTNILMWPLFKSNRLERLKRMNTDSMFFSLKSDSKKYLSSSQ